MVRTSRPLVERMALVWHDWFATSNDGVGSQRLMLNQNQLFREHGLGSFSDLLAERDTRPGDAPLAERQRQLEGVSERELRARDDGALHARRRPRLHRVGRPPAGARAHGLPERLAERRRQRELPLRPDAPRPGHQDDLPQARRVHLEGRRASLGRPIPTTGFFVRKLWSYFVAGAPDAATAALPSSSSTSRAAARCGRSSTAILKHPALYDGGRLVKPPVVYTAGLLRRIGRPIDTTSWSWIGSMAGQQLFYPPNVAGWDDTRWLDTATWRGRWWTAQNVLRPYALDPGKAVQPYDAAALVKSALAFWHEPPLDRAHARRAPRLRQGARSRMPRTRRGSASSTP